MENEIWKDIPEFEGLYQISNLGRVKSLKRNNILKSFYDKDGYKRVCLYKKIDNKDCRKYKYVHKLVAENFIIDKTKFKYMSYENIENIDINKLQVNHKNEVKDNNNVNNLEFCTNSYNMNYGCRNFVTSEKLINYKEKNRLTQPIVQCNLNGKILKYWVSISKASKAIKGNPTGIYLCLKHINKTYKGFIWKKISWDEYEEQIK